GRTANGLVKRSTRGGGGEHRARKPDRRPRPAPAKPEPPVAERTPAEVSTMLTAFRSGFQRAASDQPETQTDGES
ncbi:hypothetical protein, partial [Actinocorallia lasiicapitis]